VKNYSKAATFFVSSSFLVGFFGCFCLSNCPIYLGVGERKKKKVGGGEQKGEVKYDLIGLRIYQFKLCLKY